MAPPADRPGGLTNFQKRILSAAVLLPVVIGAIVLGHPYFTILVALFAVVMAWEWTAVAAHVRTSAQASPVPAPSGRGWRMLAALAATTVVVAVLDTGFAGRVEREGCVIIALGVLATGAVAWAANRPRMPWFMAGAVYVALPATALVAIRAEPELGRAALVWIITLVVAADTGGYLVGRTFGGPKLAPRISPNKTWSGLAGAVAGAALAGLSTAFVLNHTNVWMLTLISAGLGLVEQVGDLVESAFKRHFEVKDTSRIIPGHGGVLDRVDGLLAVALAVWIANEWAGGSVLAW
ncbi:MAG TPA: phosphatidate cytidylyltransferase [Dongiaceae bacterium]|nr:phosphatidate cytidylyltransferase [Dongiaceae bacterium]